MSHRRFSFIAIALFCTVLSCRAQSFTYDTTTWDFGEIREDGGAVEHRFRLTNAGDVPLSINQVTTSCGCTVPTFSRALILPGKSDYVTVRFEPMGYRGEVSKSVVVISNGGKNRDRLTVKASIIPRVKSLEETYPLLLEEGLRVSDTLLHFRPIAHNTLSTREIGFANTSDREILIGLEAERSSGLLHPQQPGRIAAGEKGVIRFTYDLHSADSRYGVLSDCLRITVNGRPTAHRIVVTATAIDDFSGVLPTDRIPKMTLSSQYGSFGSATGPSSRTFSIQNDGTVPLVIRSLDADAGIEVVRLGAGTRLSPGAKQDFEVRFDPSAVAKGRFYGRIILTSNDPVRPVREIKITALVR